MTKTTFTTLPSEIISRICCFVPSDVVNVMQTGKWNKRVEGLEADLFKTLKESYLQSPILAPLTTRIQPSCETDKEVVQKVYEKILKEARGKYGEEDTIIEDSLEKYKTPLSPDRLEEIAQWTEDYNICQLADWFVPREISKRYDWEKVVPEQAALVRQYFTKSLPEVCKWPYISLKDSFQLTSLPSEFKLFTKLRKLVVVNTQISELCIPASLSNLEEISHDKNVQLILPDTMRVLSQQVRRDGTVLVCVTSRDKIAPEEAPLKAEESESSSSLVLEDASSASTSSSSSANEE